MLCTETPARNREPQGDSGGGGGAPAPHLMQTCHAVVIHDAGVGSVGQQQPGHVHVAAVAGSVQGGGPTVGLGVAPGPTLQQELADGSVPVAAGVVL